MFAGHYATSFLARRLDDRLPLWSTVLAAQLLDVGWGSLVLAGVERLRIVPGFTASNPLDLYYMPFTHGLLPALGWSAATAVVAFRWVGRRAALLLGAVVFGHWLLDVPVHVPDLPLWGDAYKVGWGLWHHKWGAFALEGALVAAGVAAAWPTVRRKAALAGFGAFLLVLNVANYFGAPPAGEVAMAATSLAAYTVCTLAALPIR